MVAGAVAPSAWASGARAGGRLHPSRARIASFPAPARRRSRPPTSLDSGCSGRLGRWGDLVIQSPRMTSAAATPRPTTNQGSREPPRAASRAFRPRARLQAPRWWIGEDLPRSRAGTRELACAPATSSERLDSSETPLPRGPAGRMGATQPGPSGDVRRGAQSGRKSRHAVCLGALGRPPRPCRDAHRRDAYALDQAVELAFADSMIRPGRHGGTKALLESPRVRNAVVPVLLQGLDQHRAERLRHPPFRIGLCEGPGRMKQMSSDDRRGVAAEIGYASGDQLVEHDSQGVQVPPGVELGRADRELLGWCVADLA